MKIVSIPKSGSWAAEPALPAFDGEALMCPECGGDYLHHGVVEVFVRDREDSETGLVTKTGPCSSSVNVGRVESMKGCPSLRRDGLRIAFECEHCGDVGLCLEIAQHKGQTFMEWRRR